MLFSCMFVTNVAAVRSSMAVQALGLSNMVKTFPLLINLQIGLHSFPFKTLYSWNIKKLSGLPKQRGNLIFLSLHLTILKNDQTSSTCPINFKKFNLPFIF